MANGAFKFKDNSGNVVSFISGSDSNIAFSGGTLDLSGMTGLTLGNLTLSGTTQNAISTSHAASYLLTSSFNTYSGTTDTVIGTLQTSTSSLNSFTSSTTTRLNSIEGVSGSYATTGSNLFKGNQTISGSIIPAVDNAYDLGSVTHQFRDLYLSSASLYIDGTKVLGSTAQELQITTDTGQSFKILEAGSDNITLQSADGNIELKSSGGGDVILDPTTGVIALKGTTTLYAGNKILSSDGNAIQIGNSTTITGSLIVTGFIETEELRTTYISSSILYRSGSTKFGDELSDDHSFTGSLLVSGTISVPGSNLVSGSSQVLNGSGVWSGSAQLPSGIVSSSAQTISNLPSGTVSGSVQIDVMSTTNIARLATTGSNTFTGALSGTSATFSNLVSLGGGSEGLRLGNVGDNSAYDNVKLYYTGFSGGSPRIYLTPRTTPGSGVINTFLHLQNTNGTSTSSNNTMGLFVDGQMGIGTTSPGTKLEILSRAADADRTIPHNVLTITATQGNAPYGFFGGAILFKNSSYVTGVVESSRIRSVIYDDGAPNNFGGGLWFETTATPGGTLTPSLVLNYQGRVGIGTSAPLSPLHLQASEPTFRIVDSDDGGVTFIGSSGGYSYIRPFSRDFRVLNAAGVGLFTIKPSGNTGVGTTSPLVKLDVDGNIKNTARVFSGNAVTGNIAPNLDSAFTRSYILVCDLNDIAGFSLTGFMNAASYTCWNISSFYIMKNYSATTANAGITGQFKAGGCDMNIVDLNYGGGRYIAIGYTSNPEIDVVWTGYRLTHMLNSDGSAQVIPQSSVSVNSTLATY